MKRERYLDQLLSIMSVLRGAELVTAKKHLKAYEITANNTPGKMHQLICLIREKKLKEFEELKKRVSPDSTDDSFNKLIRRTVGRIEESLIIDVNIRRKGAYSEVFRMKFYLRKQIIQGQILMGRGLANRPQVIFETSIKYAKKYELYDELLEALYYKQSLLNRIHGMDAFVKVGEQIEYYENCRRLLNETKKVQKLFDAGISKKSNRNKISKSLRNNVKKLYGYYKVTESANILSYYYLMMIEINRSDGDLFEVSETIRGLIELLKSSPAVYSKTRVRYLLGELANSELALLKFEKAISIMNEALLLSDDKDLLSINLYINKVNVHVLLGQFEECDDLFVTIDGNEILEKYPIYFARVQFQKAMTLFGVQDFKASLNKFSLKSEIEKDKEGWNVWIRIMRILCSIELSRLDLIDYEIESFRKYIQRTDKQYKVRQRDKLVLKVLQELDRQDYDFEVTAKIKTKELEKLKSTNRKYAWNPDSPEMILFHDWFEAKRIKRPYEPNFEVYRKAWDK